MTYDLADDLAAGGGRPRRPDSGEGQADELCDTNERMVLQGATTRGSSDAHSKKTENLSTGESCECPSPRCAGSWGELEDRKARSTSPEGRISETPRLRESGNQPKGRTDDA